MFDFNVVLNHGDGKSIYVRFVPDKVTIAIDDGQESQFFKTFFFHYFTSLTTSLGFSWISEGEKLAKSFDAAHETCSWRFLSYLFRSELHDNIFGEFVHDPFIFGFHFVDFGGSLSLYTTHKIWYYSWIKQ